MSSIVLLFDLDGTLVRTGGAGGRALARAFDTHFGRPDAPGRVDVRGNTDGAILAEALSYVGAEPSDAMVSTVLATYLDALADEVARAPGYVVLPGVYGLLSALSALPYVHLGLGTGNVERGARIKLERGGLATHFGFGGYGDDAADRAALVAAGLARGASRAGPESRRVVIGDTPRDVHAARANGAEVLAVATGGHPLDELHGCAPDFTAASLEDPGVYEFLTRRGGASAAGRATTR